MKTKRNFRIRHIHPSWHLIFGILLISLTHFTNGIDLLAWISSVPFLLYLSKTKGTSTRLLFSATLIIAWSFAISKIITDPIPIFLVPLYSVPIALIQLPAYLFWDRFKDPVFRSLAFPVIMVIMEWVQYTFTPMASWGVAAYTQVDSLAIQQSVSLFGIAGLSFLIYWVNSSLVEVILHRNFKPVYASLTLAVVVAVWGSLRLDMSRGRSYETIKVAAVGTDSEIGGPELPPFEENEADIRKIFERTSRAATFGAEMVVWNEGSFYLLPKHENAWIDSIQRLARQLNISIIASYVVVSEDTQFHYDNKYIMVLADGTVDHTYLKHQPVPGEPATKGSSLQKTAVIGNARVGGAICYDYDFPYIAADNKKARADIVAVPSSDWRGIDPIHTQMAAMRAIEQGTSIIRSTRMGLSAAITPYGVMNAQMSSFDHNDRIMVSSIPGHGITTLYSIIGDLFIYLCMTGLVYISMVSFRRNKYQIT